MHITFKRRKNTCDIERRCKSRGRLCPNLIFLLLFKTKTIHDCFRCVEEIACTIFFSYARVS